eukprot:5128613-Alexandrium_andersonii.AAC.1
MGRRWKRLGDGRAPKLRVGGVLLACGHNHRLGSKARKPFLSSHVGSQVNYCHLFASVWLSAFRYTRPCGRSNA